MKKLIILAGLSVSFCLVVNAQVFVPKIGGVLTYNTEVVENKHTSIAPGFMFGLGYNLRMSDHLSFQPEIYFIRKSFNLDVAYTQTLPESQDIIYGDFHDKYRINYLEVPLTIKYKFMHEKMFFVIGPYLAYGLSGKHVYDYKTSNKPDRAGTDKIIFAKSSANSNNNVINHRLDFGFQPGLGYVLPKGLILEVRYDLGLVSTFNARSSKNQSLMLTLSYPLIKSRTEE